MKILQICKKVPYPLKDGESIAVNALSDYLNKSGHEVHLLCMNTTKHFRDMTEVKNNLAHYTSIESVEMDNSFSFIQAFMNLFTRIPFHVKRLSNRRFQIALKEMLTKLDFDIIQMETFFLSPYIQTIRENSKAIIVHRSHNVEHLIWKRLASNSRSLLKRAYLSLQANRLKNYEVKFLNETDCLLTVSEQDLVQFRGMGLNIFSGIVPIGLDMQNYKLKRVPKVSLDEFDICFIGSLDWRPNQEGLLWFLSEVWPDLKQSLGGKVNLHIAGRNAPRSIISHTSQNVIYHGEVANAQKFMTKSDVVVVPLLAGSGQRVKIIEAMAIGMPVLTTSIGLEGIAATDGKEIMVANDGREFIHKLESIYRGDIDLDALSAKAQEFANANFDLHYLGNRYMVILERLLQLTSSREEKSLDETPKLPARDSR